jgi:Tfp pilus assembly protein PilN
MNILLNLLPEDKKAHLKERVRSRFVFSQMLMLLFFQGFYVFILTGAFFALQHNESSFQGVTQRLESGDSRKSLMEIEKKFQEVNKKVEIAALLNREHFHFTELLVKLEQALPSGIALSGITTKDYRIDFSGKANERNDIVLLEKNLNGESCFTAVDIPASTWLAPKDIVFQISFSVKKECIN